MILKINDLALINKAEVEVQGLTVIAGENNTGKSTVGKVFFSIFNGFNNIEGRIRNERLKEMSDLLMREFFYNNYSKRVISPLQISNIAKAIINDGLNSAKLIMEILEERIKSVLMRTSAYDSSVDELFSSVSSKAEEIMNIPDHVLRSSVIEDYFMEVFSGQISPVSFTDKETRIILTLKENNIELLFKHNSLVSYNDSVTINHNAYYIDNPSIMDNRRTNGFSLIQRIIRAELFREKEDSPEDGIVTRALAKEKLARVMKILDETIPGRVLVENGEYGYIQGDAKEAIYFENLSMGMKSFLILKMMIEKGVMIEEDVLILDEPEIHLHPYWQLKYAEIIVLLQKTFNLSIVLTTHSPYFLRAIHVFSKNHGILDKCRFYTSSPNGDRVELEDVTNNTEKIYKKLAEPLQILEDMRWK